LEIYIVKNSRSIAHSDDFEGHKSIQTISWQQILFAWIYFIGVRLRVTKSNPYWHSLKFLAMQMGYIVVANPIGRAMIKDIGAPNFPQPYLVQTFYQKRK